jgi:hypothetical protein
VKRYLLTALLLILVALGLLIEYEAHSATYCLTGGSWCATKAL